MEQINYRGATEAIHFSEKSTTEILRFVKDIYPSLKNVPVEFPIIVDLNRRSIIATNGHWIKTLELTIDPVEELKTRYWGMSLHKAKELIDAKPKPFQLKTEDYLAPMPETKNGYVGIILETLDRCPNWAEFIKIPTRVIKLVLKRAKILKNVIESGRKKVTENTIQITVFDGLISFLMESQKGSYRETVDAETNGHKIGEETKTGLSVDYLEKLIDTKETEVRLSLNPSSPCYLDLAKSQVVIMPVRLG